jgi:hypothetical protein
LKKKKINTLRNEKNVHRILAKQNTQHNPFLFICDIVTKENNIYVMPKITVETPRITMRIPKSSAGLDRQITFLGIDWNEEARFLEIRFRCDYIVIKTIKVRNEQGQMVDEEVVEIINNPRLGLKSFIQKFKADDNTYVDTAGNIIKYPLQEPMVDLNTIHWITQYEFYYIATRTQGLNMGYFEHFINNITSLNGWEDFQI